MDISINSEICKFAVKVKVKKKEASDFMESGPGKLMPVLEEVEGKNHRSFWKNTSIWKIAENFSSFRKWPMKRQLSDFKKKLPVLVTSTFYKSLFAMVHKKI